MTSGCDSIVISRQVSCSCKLLNICVSYNLVDMSLTDVISLIQDVKLGEKDLFSMFYYTCNKHQGMKALLRSHLQKIYVRVFRSSSLMNRFSPSPIVVVKKDWKLKYRTLYRYDGLYRVNSLREFKGQDGKINHIIFQFIRVYDDTGIQEHNTYGCDELLKLIGVKY